MALTNSQQKAISALFSFLMDPEQQEIALSGGAGTGKSYITSWWIKEGYSQYVSACLKHGLTYYTEPPVVTATTNKAASVLSNQLQLPVDTIHSFLGLKVKENYKTGDTYLELTPQASPHYNKIIFIDECSMINSELHYYIKKLLQGCKIIYVGDKNQLTPVKEDISPIYDTNIPIIELTDNVRLKNHAELLDLDIQLKETVQTGEFKPIKVDGKVIQHLSGKDFKSLIEKNFISPNPLQKIITYTNKRTAEYNNFIKYDLRGYESPYVEGEIYVVGSALVQEIRGKKQTVLNTDCEVIIESVTDTAPYTNSKLPIELVLIKATKLLSNESLLFYAPKDTTQLLNALKVEAKAKNWYVYFNIKETIADLRLADAGTIHKSQGSTYRDIYIDLSDLSTCRDYNTAARLLYVACTRATDHIYLYGTLKKSLGGIIE